MPTVSTRFEQRRAEFDKSFRRMKIIGTVLGIIYSAVGLGLLAGIVYVALKVLRHFQIL